MGIGLRDGRVLNHKGGVSPSSHNYPYTSVDIYMFNRVFSTSGEDEVANRVQLQSMCNKNKWQKDHRVGLILAKTITDFDRRPGR